MKKIHYLQIFLVIFSSYQTYIISSEKVTPQTKIVNRNNRSKLTGQALVDAQEQKFSICKQKPELMKALYENYPTGATLFTDNKDLAQQFDTMVQAFKKNRESIEFIRKIHLSIISQIYDHLIKVYTNFMFTYPGYDQTQETPTTNLDEFVNYENKYAMTPKKVILNHLINLIQSQLTYLIISYNPQAEVDTAASAGKMFLQNDYGVNLQEFTQEKLSEEKIASLKTCSEYQKFFKLFTSYLSKKNPESLHNQYYTIAKQIAEITQFDDLEKAQKKMNPIMFFFDFETLRAVQYLPTAAKKLVKNSSLIPWAPDIVQAAIKKSEQNGQPVAYFKDDKNQKTFDVTKAQSLYTLTQTGSVFFEQEILAQPTWLNHEEGILKVLCGCLGSFSELIGLKIIDTTLEKILTKLNSSTL